MSNNLGDYAASTVIYGKFTTYRPSTGAPFTLAGTPSLAVYKDNSTTQSTTGVTLTVDFDAVTGLHHFAIDTSADGSFYSAGSNFDIVIAAGTVDSVSVVGSVVGSFSIAKTAALRPTTAGRTLDVSSGGEAGIDWANVGSPTTTLNLSGTSTKALEPTTAGRTLDVASTGEAGIDLGNINFPAGAVAPFGIADSGTLQAATSNTATIRAGASFGDNVLAGATLVITGGTGVGQAVLIASNVGATDVLTLSGTFTVTPDNTSTYTLFNTAAGSGGGGATAADVWAYATRTLSAATNLTSTGVAVPITGGRVDASIGAYQTGLTPLQPTVSGRTLDVSAGGEAGIDWANIGSPTTAVNLSGTNIDTDQVVASVSGAVGSVTGAVGSVTGNVGGNVTGSVGSLATQAKADVNAEVVDAISVDVIADSVPADGSRPSLTQAAYMISQFLMERSVASTTVTVRKPDGSTSLMTFTLNDATNPTSITRAS